MTNDQPTPDRGHQAPRAEHVNEIVPDALDGERLDRVVAIVFGCSRRQASEAVIVGDVSIDGVVATKPSERVGAGSTLMASIVLPPSGVQPASGVEFEVVYEDADVVVVDKPAGLVVHPGAGTTEPTMAEGLLDRYPELAEVGPADRPGIVHRLDKGTSGLLVVARTVSAREKLTEQLADRTMHRTYRTICQGSVEGSGGVIDAPLGRHPREPARRAVVADGRPARTHYQVLDREAEGAYSELECRLETGRTHQIRIHLASIGHPVAADLTYGGARQELGLTRPFLHAAELGFVHPGTDEPVSFSSALPPDLAAAKAGINWTMNPATGRDGAPR